MDLDPGTRERIEQVIGTDEVVLFMKGTPHFPQCGFSATVVKLLAGHGAQYKTVNVLTEPELRAGIKAFSSWPTIPQLYVRGKFVGGCDIINTMHESGELGALIGSTSAEVALPTITITEPALAALGAAIGEAEDGAALHLSIDAGFGAALNLAPKEEGDMAIEASGMTVLIDAATARRADGVSIDYLDSGAQVGFKIANPNAPRTVTQITAQDLKDKLDSKEITQFFDVRTPQERDICRIAGTRLLDDDATAHIESLDRKTPLAFLCHHGIRSQSAAEYFRDRGFDNIYNLIGGIDAWSTQIDATIVRY